jgi:uncharacterized protein with FMN-binding domain
VRRITYWTVATVVILILLFSYRTSLSGPTTAHVVANGAQPPGVVPGPSASSGAKSGASTPPRTGGQTPKTGAVVVNGSVIDTVWGPVQVQVHISGRKITDVTTLIYPTGTGRDQEINSYALPILRREVLAAQSANVSGVSGATYTSGGYLQSLQAALDAAHFSS